MAESNDDRSDERPIIARIIARAIFEYLNDHNVIETDTIEHFIKTSELDNCAMWVVDVMVRDGIEMRVSNVKE